MEPIPSLFDPAPIADQEGAIPQGANLPVAFRTSPEQWAYAIRFPRRNDATDPAGPVLVCVTLSVRSGTIGVGCLNRAETGFIEETMVNAGPATAELVAHRPDDVGFVVIRNASPDGPSEASVLGIECFAIGLDPDDARTPGLSQPRPCAGWNRYYGTSGATAPERVRVQSYLSISAPRTVRWVDGLSVHILPNDQLSRALYVSGTYEPNTLCVLRTLLNDGDTFLDVGANSGVISLVASKWVGVRGHVFSFEPSGREYGNLLDNLRINAATNVAPFRLAVSSGSGRADLRVAPASHAGLNTLGVRFPYDGVDVARVEAVETVALDEFVRSERLSRAAVIKLDVEGAELAALTGAHAVLRDHRPTLIIEVFSRSLEANGATRQTVEQLLREAGYHLFSIDDATARLHAIEDLTRVDEQNIVAIPRERSERFARAR